MRKRIRTSFLVYATLTFFCNFSWANNESPAVDPTSTASFNEVLHIIRDYTYRVNLNDANNEKINFNSYGYPQFDITFGTILRDSVYQRAKDTITDTANYYLKPFNKAMHRNGLCYTGEWAISEKSDYTGLLAQGTRFPMIARASVSLTETDWKPGQQRSFGLAGKIFGAKNLDQKVATANFFTVDDLNGTNKKSFVEEEFYNQPPFSFERLFKSTDRLVESTLLNALMKAVPKKLLATGIRELFPLTEYGLADKSLNKEPRWMKLQLSQGQNTLHNAGDFRKEIDLNLPEVRKAYPNGIQFDIFVSEALPNEANTIPVTQTKLGTMQRDVQWKKLGKITLNESYNSFGCDFMLHYHHADFRGSLIENVNPKIGSEINDYINFLGLPRL